LITAAGGSLDPNQQGGAPYPADRVAKASNPTSEPIAALIGENACGNQSGLLG
jgi:K+-transporting ATPase c subunit